MFSEEFIMLLKQAIERNPDLEIFYDFSQATNTKDPKINVELLSKLNFIGYTLIEKISLSKYDLKPEEELLDTKLKMFFLNNSSIISLLLGTGIQSLPTLTKGILKEKLARDHTAIETLLRKQIEAFTIIRHLYELPKSKEEGVFRIAVYKAFGLSRQLEIGKSTSDSPQNAKLKKIITEELEVANRIIKTSKILSTLSEDNQAKALNHQFALLIGKKDLFKQTGLYSKKLYSMWSLWSNVAHNEYIADRQFHSNAQSPKESIGSLFYKIQILSLITASMIKFIIEKFPVANNHLVNELPPEFMNLLDLYIKGWYAFDR